MRQPTPSLTPTHINFDGSSFHLALAPQTLSGTTYQHQPTHQPTQLLTYLLAPINHTPNLYQNTNTPSRQSSSRVFVCETTFEFQSSFEVSSLGCFFWLHSKTLVLETITDPRPRFPSLMRPKLISYIPTDLSNSILCTTKDGFGRVISKFTFLDCLVQGFDQHCLNII